MQSETDLKSTILSQLRTISTSNQWSVLSGILTKLNKKLSEPLTEEELGTFIQTVPKN